MAPDAEAAQTLGEYFSSVFIDEGQYAQSYNEKMNMDTGLSDITINRDTVIKKLQKLQMDKAQGPDAVVHPAVLKNCAEIIPLPLTLIYEKSLQECQLPSDWKTANRQM